MQKTSDLLQEGQLSHCMWQHPICGRWVSREGDRLLVVLVACLSLLFGRAQPSLSDRESLGVCE